MSEEPEVDRGAGSARTGGRQRTAIAVVQVLGLAVWFSVSAVVPSLREDWGISSTTAVWLIGAVQVGFVTGAVGLSLTPQAGHRRCGVSDLGRG